MAVKPPEGKDTLSIKIDNLNFSYSEKKVLQNINLEIETKSAISILGPNGAGKTTLLRIIAGLLKTEGESVSYDGKNFKHYDPREMARLVGFVPQIIVPAFDYSVIDYVVTGCAPQLGTFQRPRREHYDKALKSIRELGIEHIAQRSYRQISGGERQQVSIARVLTQSPSYILMDEPTSHLDYGNQIRVLKTIKDLANNGFGVVFTTHNPDQALLVGGKTALIGRDGKLIFGDSRELLNESVLSQLYGTKLRISDPENSGRKVCYPPSLD
jgi:iron complex transport system ATP-binding protein